MDELRSLEGVGHLLSQKLNENDNNKIKSKPKHVRSTSLPPKMNCETTASITISTATYFPPQLAEAFANGIVKGFDQDMPSDKPILEKSQSGFVQKAKQKQYPIDDSKENTTTATPSKQSKVHFANQSTTNQTVVISPQQSMSPPMSPSDMKDLTLENQYNQNSSGTNGPTSYTSGRGSIGHGILGSHSHGHFQPYPSSPSLRMGSFRTGNSLHLDLGIMNELGLTDDENDGYIHSTRTTNGSITFPQANGSIDSPIMKTIFSPEEMNFPNSVTSPTVGTVPPLRKVISNNELFTLYSGDENNMSSTDDVVASNTAANRSIPMDCVPNIEEKTSIDMNMKLEDFMEYQSEQKDGFNNIGNGASGIVKKAFHFRSCNMVAIKQCRSKKTHEITAFLNEAKLYEKFSENKNICSILGFGKDDNGNMAMAMEYMDLGSIDKLNTHSRKNKEMIVSYIIYNVLHGLNALHNKKYVHNDIKPANILCNKYGEIKLSDFGTVLQLKKRNKYLLNINNGTQRYQSPEKLIGKQLAYNCSNDIWSIGVSTFELLFGDNYKGMFSEKLSYVNNTPNMNDKKLYNISNECSHFIFCCFEKDYTKRKSVAELIKHKWFKNIQNINEKQQLNKNIWPWYIPMPDCRMVQNMIYNPMNGIGRERSKAIKSNNKQQPQTQQENNIQELYNVDLLFMISALIIYYSAQFFDDLKTGYHCENEKRFLHRRRSAFQKDNQNGKVYSDDERITNMAKYACCSKDIVLQKIRLTVNYIKSQIKIL